MTFRFSARVALCAAFALLCAPVAASAHGDAASHYLETGSLYPSFAAQPSHDVELQLIGLLDAAKRAHYPLKVAPARRRERCHRHARDAGQAAGVRGVRRGAARRRAGARSTRPCSSSRRPGSAWPAPGRTRRPRSPASPAPPVAPAISSPSRRRPRSARSPPRAGIRCRPTCRRRKVPVVAPQSTPGSGYGLGGLTPFVVFAAIFGSALALYEGRARLARRRRSHVTPTGEAA